MSSQGILASIVSHKVDIVLQAVYAIPKLEIHNGSSTHDNVHGGVARGGGCSSVMRSLGSSLWSLKEGPFFWCVWWVFLEGDPEDKDLGGGPRKY